MKHFRNSIFQKRGIKMNKKTFQIIVFLLVFCSQGLFSYAYDNETTHPYICGKAVEETIIFNNYLVNNLGLPQGIKTKLFGSKTIVQWLQSGSLNEDEPNCKASNHFHNPLLPWDESFMSDDTTDIGSLIRSYCGTKDWPFSDRKSNVTWATGYLAPSPNGAKEGEWGVHEPVNWDTARTYYYAHLTGKDFEGNVIAESDYAREISLAWSFEALGHVLHLIQDVSVPAHVRNDFTSHLTFQGISFYKPKTWFLQPFEYYVQVYGKNITEGSPADAPELENIRLTDYWDTDQFTGSNPSTSLSQGLAEFTNANYLSDSTIPNNSPKPEHQFTYPLIDSLGYQIVEEDIGTEKRKYIARKNPIIPPLPGQNDTFACVSLLNKENEIADENIANLKLWLNDDNVNNTYASELIPRAIGYSSALLEYFFRGTIDISLPDDGIYAFTDDPASGFTNIKLKAVNTTTNNEEMTNGTVELVVKYRLSQGDPFKNYTPPENYPGTTSEFYYKVVPEVNGATSIPRNNAVEFIFDLTGDNAIPLWATDVYLYVVFKGKLGNENNAVAVGFKDISEPTPFDIINNMDKICIDNNWMDAGSAEAIAAVDTDENGIADPYEWDVYSHDLDDMFIRFSPAPDCQDPSCTEDDIVIPSMAAGEYNRLFVLTDYQFCFSYCATPIIHTHPDDQFGFNSLPAGAGVFPGLKNQAEYEDSDLCGLLGLESPCYIRYIPEFVTFKGVDRWDRWIFDNAPYPSGSTCPNEALE
jgi:hypothetical protein